mmetsp:Transcript_14047/g.52661  ORF Transcript_14047/g.52661 Transcript_14047/m.52661 type:complete len:214 (-) Transcript_14047:118-759(-)
MRVIKQSTGTSGEYARVRSVCGVLHPGRARFTASLASQITAMQVPYPLIVPVPRPPPCAATLRFRAASACSYRLCWISFLVCGFSEPPGRRYSHSAHAPAARSTNNPIGLGSPSPPGSHPSPSSSPSSGGMPSPPYPNLRWSPVSMRSGAAPGPRLAPPEPPPLGKPLGLSSSPFGFFPAPAMETGLTATGRWTPRRAPLRGFKTRTSRTVAS